MERQDHLREDYRRQMDNERPNSIYNDYRTQPPYYGRPKRHHPFIWVLVIILCIGLGWFAGNHFLGDSSTTNNSTTRTTINKPQPNSNGTSKTNSNSAQNQPSTSSATQKLQREMNRLNVSEKDQVQAYNYYEKQSPKGQAKINKIVSMINKLVPSNTLKQKLLDYILKD